MTQKVAQQVISLLVLLATINLKGLLIAVNAAGRVSATSHRSADLHIHKVHANNRWALARTVLHKHYVLR